MAWEWVAPTATAAATTTAAIAGIAATYLTAARARRTTLDVARLTLEEARSTKLRDERREVYSQYLDVVDEIQARLRSVSVHAAMATNKELSKARQLESQRRLIDATDQHGEAAARLLNATNRIFLVSPGDLREAVTDMPKALQAMSTAAHEGRFEPLDAQVLVRVHLLMRRELGIPPS